ECTNYFVLDGNIINFYDASQRKYLTKGWSSTEQWGTWSEGNESVILVNFKRLKDEIASSSARNDRLEALPTPTPPSPHLNPLPQGERGRVRGEDIGGGSACATADRKDYTMIIKATGFSIQGKQQSVKVYLDDNLLGEYTFTHPVTYFEDIEIKIPSAYIKEDNQKIKFVYSFTGVPAEHGMGPDLRQLAMGVSSIEFR
ncbi:MAG TPA: hypothetical protein VI387_05185, partial [Candidatus Brocadiales bacterium]|nr:hypothetical protein [Candidatus Brocadiales bacterium]